MDAKKDRSKQATEELLHTLSFAEQVSYRLAHPNARARSLWLGRTPAPLRMLGFPDLPLRMSPGVLIKIATGKGGERSGIPEKFIRRLPEMLDDPEAVFESKVIRDALVVLITARASDGRGRVVVSVEANLKDANAHANMVTSAYAKDREEWIPEQIAAGRLRYCGKTKGPDILEVSGHTLNRVTEPGSQNPSLANILLPEDLRKYRETSRNQKLNELA